MCTIKRLSMMSISINQAERIVEVVKRVEEGRVTFTDKMVKIVIWTVLRDSFCSKLFITVNCMVELELIRTISKVITIQQL